MGCEDRRNSNPKCRSKPQDKLSSYAGMVCSFSHSYQCFYYGKESAFSALVALALLSPLDSAFKYFLFNNNTICLKLAT